MRLSNLEQELIQNKFGEYKEKGDELILKKCIYCGGGEHGKDKETAAYNVEKKVYNCKRATCRDTDKNLWQMLRDFNMISKRKEYRKPKTKAKPLNSEWEQYFFDRGISKETLKRCKVRLNKNAAIFPYYENGECVMLKFRTKNKKIWREEGGKPILWGMDDCDLSQPLVIVEGEIDRLSLLECGVNNAVSVPSGASDMTWVELCYDWIDIFERVIIWPDNDADGKELAKRLPSRIGEWKCSVVESPHKDPNDHLMAEGKESVLSAIEDAKDIPISGLVDIYDVEQEEIQEEDIIKFGIEKIDNLLNGSIMGSTTIWSGTPGSGKSTFLSQNIIESVEQGERFCAYSRELTAYKFKVWLYKQIAGDHNLEDIERNGFIDSYVKRSAWKRINEYYRGKVFIYDSKILPTSKDILTTFQSSYKRYGTRLFLIDNIASTGLEGGDDNTFEQQKVFMWKMKDFADRYNVHVHIVAHPRKIEGKIGIYDIFGSSDLVNFADNIYTLHRISDEDKENNAFLEDYSTIFSTLKNREYGQANKTLKLKFLPRSKRFFGEEEHQGFKRYSWERSGIETREIVLNEGGDV